ncbi:UNVERIFIED_CONTAM: hypothetical protein Sradi_5012800 [Sesamum radiatum]|uniref:MSP domain-containing protein n=1 Tax=Sesamum radiatum TaxID=300843 RepID=A0AAW2MIF3_SESRA
MGAKCCVFVNKSNVEMELRVFLPPARPDKYRKIIRIKPGEVKFLKTAKLCCEDSGPEQTTHLMIFVVESTPGRPCIHLISRSTQKSLAICTTTALSTSKASASDLPPSVG